MEHGCNDSPGTFATTMAGRTTLVTAYGLKRPEGQWSLMIVNRDRQNTHRVRIFFQSETDHAASSFVGKADIATFGKDQYQWHPGVTRFAAHAEHAGDLSVVANTKGMADPDGPIVHTNQTADHAADHAAGYDLPAASIVVLRGRVGVQK